MMMEWDDYKEFATYGGIVWVCNVSENVLFTFNRSNINCINHNLKFKFMRIIIKTRVC